MPSVGGATEWLNSGPLGPAGLRGHVVLVNFWTLTCINWLRQEPYVRAWSRAYRADGLVVIGVHTPEFSFEHETERVRQAVKQREIDYPVVVDNRYEVPASWSSSGASRASRMAASAMFSALSTWPPLGSQHSRRGCRTRAVSHVPASSRNTNRLDVGSLITMLPP
jgi:thiol-disulfide isomerase/thioredoxin